MKHFSVLALALLLLFTAGANAQQTRIVLHADPQSITYPAQGLPTSVGSLRWHVYQLYYFIASLNPDMILVGGDLNEHGETPYWQDTLIAMVTATGVYSVPNTTFYPAPGDHDAIGVDGDWSVWKTQWQDRWDLPGNKTYYTVVENNVCAIQLTQSNSLTSVREGNTQYNWLVAELERANANPNIDWIILTWHYPPMEIGSGTSGASYVMPYLMKLCRDYNVDIVNTGHQHVLHRTHPVTFRDSVPPSRPWATVCIPVVVGPGEGTTFLCAARSELALNGSSPAYYHAIAVGSNSSGSQRIGNTGVECKKDAVYKLEIDGLVGKGYGVISYDEKKCRGAAKCGVCASRCKFGALSVVGDRLRVNTDRCYGCGVCIETCPGKALYLTPRPNHILNYAPPDLVAPL